MGNFGEVFNLVIIFANSVKITKLQTLQFGYTCVPVLCLPFRLPNSNFINTN